MYIIGIASRIRMVFVSCETKYLSIQKNIIIYYRNHILSNANRVHVHNDTRLFYYAREYSIASNIEEKIYILSAAILF